MEKPDLKEVMQERHAKEQEHAASLKEGGNNACNISPSGEGYDAALTGRQKRESRIVAGDSK